MCCLFGIHDYGHSLSQKQKNRLLSVLSVACEARGTDATQVMCVQKTSSCSLDALSSATYCWCGYGTHTNDYPRE